MNYDEARRSVHEAISGLLNEGEIALSWTLTIDVAGSSGHRYLAHRFGGGSDGTESPMPWSALGMMRAAVLSTEDQLRAQTTDADDDA